MGWETGLAIALLLVGIGVSRAVQPLSREIAEWVRARRERGGRAAGEEERLASIQEQIDGLQDRLDRIEERVDFNEELLRDRADRQEIEPPSDPTSGGSGGPAPSGSEDTSEEESP